LLAQDAARLIRVHYEPLLHVIEVDDAIKPDAPAIRAGSADHTRPRWDTAGSRKAGERPVKVVMTRSEVLRATGPTRPKIMGSSVEWSTLGVQISSKVG
jgi:CO/xanthine dehydrogenase Mo-binding subunit